MVNLGLDCFHFLENDRFIFKTKHKLIFLKKIETTKLNCDIFVIDCFLNKLSYRCFVFRFSKVQNE